MSLTKKNEFGIGDVNFTTMMDTLNKAFIGLHKCSLTNYETTSAPALAAGSGIEVNGAMFFADSEESITGSPSDGTVYIKVVPDGDEATLEYTNTAPVWDETKQGWYSPTSGEENHRYIGGCTKSGTDYTNKFILISLSTIGLKAYGNRIAFSFLDDVQIGELIIGDLKMYAYGDLLISEVAKSVTEEFYLLKPCHCFFYTQESSYSTQYGSLVKYADGAYQTTTNIPCGFNLLYPGRYKISGGSYVSSVGAKLTCVFAEGMNELDIDKIKLSI